MTQKIKTKVGHLYQSKKIAGLKGIVHGFGVKGQTVAGYLGAMGIRDRFIFATDQIHGSKVHCLMRPKKGGLLKGDAFVTDRPGLVCFVRTADCVPILIVDPKVNVVAAVHAGWRGSAENVVGKTIGVMKNVYGAEPENCIAAIGPSICGECYEVGDEVIKVFSNLDIKNDWRISASKIDLGAVNKFSLERAGLLSSNISTFDNCTRCQNEFASYRRDKAEVSRQFNFIMISR